MPPQPEVVAAWLVYSFSSIVPRRSLPSGISPLDVASYPISDTTLFEPWLILANSP